MSRRNLVIIAVAFVALLITAYITYDLVTVTDEERLEGFVDDVTGNVDLIRIQHAELAWVDLARQPLEVSALGRTQAFGEGEDDALEAEAVRALRPMYGSHFSAMSRSIAIDQSRATVTLRLVSRERGMFNTQWTLEKHGEDWLVARVAVQR